LGSGRGAPSCTSTFRRLSLAGRGSTQADGLPKEPWLSYPSAVKLRAALPHSQCDWHFWLCADFSSSAPLGLQFAVCCSRRNRSSPRQIKYTTASASSLQLRIATNDLYTHLCAAARTQLRLCESMVSLGRGGRVRDRFRAVRRVWRFLGACPTSVCPWPGRFRPLQDHGSSTCGWGLRYSRAL
jgi:hypothetical protein